MHLQIRFLTSTLCRPVFRVCTNQRKLMHRIRFRQRAYRRHRSSRDACSILTFSTLFQPLVRISTITRSQAISTAIVRAPGLRLSCSYQKRTNAVTSWLPPSWGLLAVSSYPFTAPQHADPSPKPVLCTSRVELATPNLHRLCPPVSPLSNPLRSSSRPGPRLVHAATWTPCISWLSNQRIYALRTVSWILASVFCHCRYARGRVHRRRSVRNDLSDLEAVRTIWQQLSTHAFSRVRDHFSSTPLCCCSSPQRLAWRNMLRTLACA
jgi:hypothetical protein